MDSKRSRQWIPRKRYVTGKRPPNDMPITICHIHRTWPERILRISTYGTHENIYWEECTVQSNLVPVGSGIGNHNPRITGNNFRPSSRRHWCKINAEWFDIRSLHSCKNLERYGSETCFWLYSPQRMGGDALAKRKILEQKILAMGGPNVQ